MKLHFCTLFNSAYLSRGLAMYESLLEHCKDFHLYVFAFDQKCYDYLSAQKFEHLTVISLKEFENPDLLRVKKDRTAAEYCWTCSASTIHYCITTFQLSNCTYIDADMLFYADPKVLVDEMGTNSVLITSHRYSPAYDQSVASGKYCVQFVTFKNDDHGMIVLNWWKNACIEWCYARVEDGKFGDQKYLDEFAVRFKGVHELEHLGGGLAPWNIQQYEFKKENGKLLGTELRTSKKFEVVFFHFHGLKFYENNLVSFTNEQYVLSQQVQHLFYRPYVQLLNAAKKKVNKTDNSFDPHGNAGVAPYKEFGFKTLIQFYLEGIKNSRRNVFGLNLRGRMSRHYFFKNNEDFN